MRKSKLKNKLLTLVIGISILVSTMVWGFSLNSFLHQNKQRSLEFEIQLRKDSDEKLKNLVETSSTLINGFYERAQKGELTVEQAKLQAKELVRGIRYDNNKNYFWIDTTEGVNVLLPNNPKIEGTNRVSSKDVNNYEYVKSFLEKGVSGGGYTDYWFPKLTGQEAYPKRGYTLEFKPFKWVIGTGYYIDNIDEMISQKKVEFDLYLREQIIRQALLLIFALASIYTAATYFSKKIINPVNKLNELIIKTSKYNLVDDSSYDYLLKNKDEIGDMADSIIKMRRSLQSIVNNILNSCTVVNTAASEISSGNEDLSQRTQEQAASLEETSSAIEELTATVKQNADNAQKANNMSNEVAEVVTKGNNIVKETIGAMENATVSSKKINDIISVVNEIAFQTNLLALNAAVEAARAGEQGRGFAVVASEVRNLAQRSGEAAKEIQNLIKDSVEKIQNGNGLVLKTGNQLDIITNKVREMSVLISEIAAASKEQSVGIDEVNKAITQMDQVTQQNAALVEESAASSQAMNHEAQELLNLAAQFKVSEEHINNLGVKSTNQNKSKENKTNNIKNHQAKEISDIEGFEKF